MEISSYPFHILDWSSVPKEEDKGKTGIVYRQVFMMGEIESEKWNTLPVTKQIIGAAKDILFFAAGMTYFVGDDCEAHRSSTQKGCKLFIVD
ncbi:MAG TPA: hypothetical protein VFH08_08000 [Chitinophagaceae bacterium]|nr:hypothetical protein [Chitinophagaceae bacterium]